MFYLSLFLVNNFFLEITEEQNAISKDLENKVKMDEKGISEYLRHIDESVLKNRLIAGYYLMIFYKK